MRLLYYVPKLNYCGEAGTEQEGQRPLRLRGDRFRRRVDRRVRHFGEEEGGGDHAQDHGPVDGVGIQLIIESMSVGVAATGVEKLHQSEIIPLGHAQTKQAWFQRQPVGDKEILDDVQVIDEGLSESPSDGDRLAAGRISPPGVHDHLSEGGL